MFDVDDTTNKSIYIHLGVRRANLADVPSMLCCEGGSPSTWKNRSKPVSAIVQTQETCCRNYVQEGESKVGKEIMVL